MKGSKSNFRMESWANQVSLPLVISRFEMKWHKAIRSKTGHNNSSRGALISSLLRKYRRKNFAKLFAPKVSLCGTYLNLGSTYNRSVIHRKLSRRSTVQRHVNDEEYFSKSSILKRPSQNIKKQINFEISSRIHYGCFPTLFRISSF